MRSVLAATAAAALSIVAAPASADPSRAECIDANTKAQDARRDLKFSAARELLRTCSASSCPGMVRDDCIKRLDEVEHLQPTIIFACRDAAGNDYADVKVTVDGKVVAEKLNGSELAIDPGEHWFVFEIPNHEPIAKKIVLTQGERARRDAIQVGGPPALQPPPPNEAKPVEPAGSSATQPPRAEPTPSTSGPPFPMKTVGFVVGGVGLVGLAMGTLFGAVALHDVSAGHCDANHVCDSGTTSGIKSAALISDIGWIAGGVLTAAGVGLVIFSPKGSPSGATGLRFIPVVTADGAVGMIHGSF